MTDNSQKMFQKNNLIVRVCLDQCAISQMAIWARTNSIKELKKLMIDAFDRGQLICPIARETIAETTALPSESRFRIHELHSYLAGARDGSPPLAFKTMWKTINEETLALARSEPPPSAFERCYWERIEDDHLASEIARDLRDGKDKMEQRGELHQTDKKQQFSESIPMRSPVIFEHASHVYRQINRLLNDDELSPEDHMGYSLCKYLQAQGISKSELRKLSEDIRCRRWELIPVIFNRTRLSSQLEKEFLSKGNSRRYKANDEFDISRIAVGLASSDIVITDSSMSQLCRTVKTSRWTQTKVFAVSETRNIIAYLEEVLS